MSRETLFYCGHEHYNELPQINDTSQSRGMDISVKDLKSIEQHPLALKLMHQLDLSR